MAERNYSDEDLKETLKKFNESELHGVKFGLFPAEKMPEGMTNHDTARMMELNPKGHY